MSELELKVLADIKTQMGDETLGAKIIKRLQSLNYELKSEDGYLILFCIEKASNSIMNFCNIKKVPEKLENILVDKVCGEFLLSQKNSGKLNIDETLKSLKDGNVTVTYDEKSSADSKLNVLINHLIDGGRGELICYRRIKWN